MRGILTMDNNIYLYLNNDIKASNILKWLKKNNYSSIKKACYNKQYHTIELYFNDDINKLHPEQIDSIINYFKKCVNNFDKKRLVALHNNLIFSLIGF